MAYTRAWSEVIPAGSDLANTIDDSIRFTRVDERERMDTILGAGQWATDPVVDWTQSYVIAAQWMAGAVTKIDNINIAWDAATGDANVSYVFPLTVGASFTLKWAIPFIVPVGCTITKIQSSVYCAAGGSLVSAAARRGNGTSGGIVMGTDAALSSGNAQTYDHAISNYTVVSGDTFWVYFTLQAATANVNARLYGIKVTYTRPNIQKVY